MQSRSKAKLDWISKTWRPSSPGLVAVERCWRA
uniref:Uncharacterized protein n=1 Tax=Setaria italica TaxID=4555 RepID=K4A4C3_SETIT